MLKKTQTIGSLKNQRNIKKTNWSLATEADKPKTSLLSSESAIKKLTYQNKQRKTEQLLNETSPINIWNESHQNFSTLWFAIWKIWYITWMLAMLSYT